MGLNTVGSVKSKVTMYANKYPFSDDIFKLWGAIEDYGAQELPEE